MSLKVTKIPSDTLPFSQTFPCILAEQPIGELYSAVIPHNVLYDICEFDVRRVISESRDVERYLGVQRPLSDSRVREIAKYVNFTDATFPSAIIIAVDERCVDFDRNRNEITLRNVIDDERPVPKRMIARVIDGQHRVAGLKSFSPTEDDPSFDCLVTILVGMDPADQGHVFATVNLAQTKVNRSLAIDLYALERTRSPIKTCHSVVVALDKDPKGPFYRRIKRLGVATRNQDGVFVKKGTETLTQATVVDGLRPYITNDPDGDRDVLLRGGRLSKVDPTKEQQLIFRNWFIEDEDGKIALVFSNYFDAVKGRWNQAWSQPNPGQILSRTTGYLALSRLLGPAYLKVSRIGDVASVEQFAALFARSQLTDAQLNAEEFLPGSSGQGKLFRQLYGEMIS